MLTRLVIQDVVLIDRLVLDFVPGLNVLTGETGAGKSIVLDALGLALGARADTGLVREGTTQASVAAEFELADAALLADIAVEQNLDLSTQLILRRSLSADGKSRAYVNDQPIGVTLLKRIGDRLLEIHGQFETYGLLNARTHRGILDNFAGLLPMQQQTAAAFAAWQQAVAEHEQALKRRAQAEAEEDFVRAAAAELAELAPQPGEIDQLTKQRASLQHRDKLLEALQQADTLLQSDRGALTQLTQAARAIGKMADKLASLNELLAALDRATDAASEAAQQAEKLLGDLTQSDDTLQTIEDRLFTLRAVARKHSVQPEALPQLREDFAQQLALLGGQGDHLTRLAKQVTITRAAYVKLAQELSAKRQKSADALAKQVMKELPPLKLERARFMVTVEALPEAQWNADGIDKVSFMAATNPGAAAGPINKVASGGELSRFMLALKVVLAQSDPVPTLVFDEVDAGIGGATAAAVGERLARLGEQVQVLVVTHSPQVAARGQHHLQVHKQDKTKRPTTIVKLLESAERIDEIARMIAGSEVTPAARAAAEELIESGNTKGIRISLKK
jgi:DNA repair protein RecN (Recombination protein N)